MSAMVTQAPKSHVFNFLINNLPNADPIKKKKNHLYYENDS